MTSATVTARVLGLVLVAGCTSCSTPPTAPRESSENAEARKPPPPVAAEHRKPDPYLAHIIQIDSLNDASCALDDTGALYCWGVSSPRALEEDTTPFFGNEAPTPVRIAPIEDAPQLAFSQFSLSGQESIAALDQSGRLHVAGPTGFSTEDTPTPPSKTHPSPYFVPAADLERWMKADPEAVQKDGLIDSKKLIPTSITGVKHLVGSTSDLCWVDTDEVLRCEPSDYRSDRDRKRLLPNVLLDRDCSQCFASGESVQCQYSNGCKVLSVLNGGCRTSRQGYVDTHRFDVPSTPTELAYGRNHACVLTEDGNVVCETHWPPHSGASRTERFSREGEYVAMAVAGWYLVCAAPKERNVECFEIRQRDPDGPPSFDFEVPASAGIVQLSAGERHVCGLHQDGHILCWGRNLEGQLGRGDSSPGDDMLGLENGDRTAKPVLAPIGGQPLAPRGRALKRSPSARWFESKVEGSGPRAVVWRDDVSPVP